MDIDFMLYAVIVLFVGYDLFFMVASFFKRKRNTADKINIQRFAVIFAAYKEDRVIQESVERFLLQDYPDDKYRVIVVSDQMQEATNLALAKLPIDLHVVRFEQSMKHKSVSYALDRLESTDFERVVIMDADNVTDTDFLTRINQVTQSGIALQAHRTRKNENTPTAIWDGISEEINNTIFRKGHVNMGLSSALIGSGMVFDLAWLKQNMHKCSTFAEDKELEIMLAAKNIFVDYADDIYVYDEKTTRQEILLKQRARWFHAQILAFSLIIKHFKCKDFNLNYLDKTIQWIPFPRLLRMVVIVAAIIFCAFFLPEASGKWYGLLLLYTLTCALSIPKRLYTPLLLASILKLPLLMIVLSKSYIASLVRVKNKDTSFQSTPHNVTNEKKHEQS